MFISKELLGIIAAALVFVAYVPYIRDIIRKQVLPHPYSWLIWSLTSTVIFFIQTSSGSGSGAYMTLTVALLAFCIFILALKNNKTKISVVDIACLIIACAGIVIWLAIDVPLVSIIVLLSVELVGFIPTLIKGWQQPYDDSATLWGVNSARHSTGLLAVQQYSVITVLNPLVWLVLSVSLSSLLLIRRADMKRPKLRKRKFRPFV